VRVMSEGTRVGSVMRLGQRVQTNSFFVSDEVAGQHDETLLRLLQG